MKLRHRARALPLAGLLAVCACGEPQAWGEANSLILIAADSLWEENAEATYAVLEPTIFTTRDEKQYEVTHVSPAAPGFPDLQIFRNVIVLGVPDDLLIQEAAAAAGIELHTVNAPRTFQTSDVWARAQTVTAVVLRPGQETNDWLMELPSVLAAVDERYRRWVRTKMFATPPDTALAAQLGARFGFSMLVPRVYGHVVRGMADGDSLVILRNDNPDPSVLIRSVLVDWGPPVDSLTAAAALEWRAGIDSVHYNVPQAMNTERSAVTRFSIEGREGLEVTGIWEDEEGGFPAAGPFVVWLVACPDRTYYIDGWVYAPNDSKYEYLLQLQEILGSFRCVARGA